MRSSRSFIINSERFFSWLVCFLWGYHAFFRFLGIAFNRIPLVGSLFMPIIVSILIIGAVPYILRCIHSSDVLFTIITLLIVILTLFINAQTTKPFEDIWLEFSFQCFIMYFVGLAGIKKMGHDKKLIETMCLISMFSILTLTIIYNATSSGAEYEWSSNQYIPYSLLPHILLLLASLFEQMSIVKLALVLYGTLNLVMLGNRGSVVCLLVMLLLLSYFKTKELESKKKYIFLLFLLLLLFIVWGTNIYEMALLGAYKYALEHNLSTRVFQTFLGEYTSGTTFDSGRLDIQRDLLQRLKENPFGYGLGSDRYFATQYAHNILLEIALNFGVFVGGAMIIELLSVLIRGFKLASSRMEIRNLFFIFLCLGFVKLFISGSYLTDPYFFILLGMSIGLKRETKQQTYIDENNF